MSFLTMIACAGLLLGASPLLFAADGSVEAHSADASKGRKIFVKYCSGCHGAEGQGDGYRLLGPTAANLLAPGTTERSDEELLRTIHEGRPNMPVWKYRLSPQDSKDVLTYIRSLPTERNK